MMLEHDAIQELGVHFAEFRGIEEANNLQDRVLIFVLEHSLRAESVDMGSREGVYKDVSEDAAEPPLILDDISCALV